MGTAYHHSASGNIEFVFTDGKARHYPRHVHLRHWTAGIVYGGTVTLTTDTGARDIRSGQHFLVSPMEPHSLDVGPDNSMLAFCFDSVDSFTEGKAILRHFSGNMPFPHGLETMLLRKIRSSCAINPASGRHGFQNFPDKPDSRVNRSVQEVILLLQDNPDRFSDIGQMARYAGYSRWHFLRAFRQFTGFTPHAFQSICRLRHLRGLLRQGSGAALAAAVAGFFDQSHMYKAFKRHHGITPEEFRQASVSLKPQ